MAKYGGPERVFGVLRGDPNTFILEENPVVLDLVSLDASDEGVIYTTLVQHQTDPPIDSVPEGVDLLVCCNPNLSPEEVRAVHVFRDVTTQVFHIMKDGQQILYGDLQFWVHYDSLTHVLRIRPSRLLKE